jgi:hypothetical protein
LTTPVGTKEQKVFPRYRNPSQEALGEVVIDAEAAVLYIAGQGIPARERVLQGLAEWCLPRQSPALSFRPFMECIEQWLAASLTLPLALLGGLALDVRFDGIQFLDPA